VSDNICWIVDIEAGLEEAPTLAHKGLEWLIRQGIAESLPARGGALSGAGLYRPGPKAAALDARVLQPISATFSDIA